MGRKKKGRQHISEGTPSSRATTAGNRQAQTRCVCQASSTASEPGTRHDSPHAFLSYQQLAAMRTSDKVTMQLPYIPRQELQIYTTAGNIAVGVQFFESKLEIVGRTGLTQSLNSALKTIKQQNPEELFHKMNTGTDTDLFRWRQFSALCIYCAIVQYVLNGTPMRVWADDDTLLPAQRATRERARLTSFACAPKEAPSSSSKVAPALAPVLKELEEVEEDANIDIEMKELLGWDLVTRAPRRAVQNFFNEWYPHMLNPLVGKRAEQAYEQRMAKLGKSMSRTNTVVICETCMELAVLARLLYDKPLRVRPPGIPALDFLFPESCMDGDHNTILVHNPSSEMMQPIVIPDSVADKGGYIVVGEFRPGLGIETVHLKFSDFEPDDDIILQLSDPSDVCMLEAILPNHKFISEIVHAKRIVSKHKETAELVVQHMHAVTKLPDHPSFLDQLITEDPDASTQATRIVQQRKRISQLRQALHGTPARLHFRMMHDASTDVPSYTAYLKNVSELCLKKLEEISNIEVTGG